MVFKSKALLLGREPKPSAAWRKPSKHAQPRVTEQDRLNLLDCVICGKCLGHLRSRRSTSSASSRQSRIGLDPTSAARALWLSTHPHRSQ